MNESKITSVCILLVLMFYVTSNPAHAGCSRRQLQNTCNSCAQQILNSSQCTGNTSNSNNSTCLSSNDLFNQAKSLLRNSYTLSISLQGNGTHNYSLSISNISNAGTVSYSVTDLNADFNFLGVGTLAITALGGGLLNIDVPFIISDATLYDLVCTITIKSNGTLLGACSSILALNSNVGTVLNGTLTSL